MTSNTNAARFGEFLGAAVTNAINVDSNRDGKIQGAEIATLALNILIQGAQVFESVDDAIKELKTGGSAARVAFINGIKFKFDLRDDQVEELIERTISYIEGGITLANDWADLRKPQEAISQPETVSIEPVA